LRTDSPALEGEYNPTLLIIAFFNARVCV